MSEHQPASAAPTLDDLAERFSVLPRTEVFAALDMLRDMLVARCDNPLDAIDDDDKPRRNRHQRRRAAKLAQMGQDPDSVPERKGGYPVCDSDRDAYDIATFCQRNSISVSGFYQMKREGWGPDTFFVGKRQLVSREAAERWRRERERVAAADLEATAARRPEPRLCVSRATKREAAGLPAMEKADREKPRAK